MCLPHLFSILPDALSPFLLPITPPCLPILIAPLHPPHTYPPTCYPPPPPHPCWPFNHLDVAPSSLPIPIAPVIVPLHPPSCLLSPSHTPLPAPGTWILVITGNKKTRNYLRLNQDMLQLLLNFFSFTNVR